MQENIKVTGDLRIIHNDEFGNLINEYNYKNLIVTTGKNWVAGRVASNATTVMSHMALGTSSTAASVGDTALIGTELGRVALTSTTASTNTVIYVATFGAGVATGAITEAGIFGASSGGTMLNRIVFLVINKASGDTITVTWIVTFN